MMTITGVDGRGGSPLGGRAGTGVGGVRAFDAPVPPEPRLVGAVSGDPGSATTSLLAGITLGGAGMAALGSGLFAGRLGAAGIGRGVGIALGVGAVAGAAFLLHRSAQERSEEYLVHFAAEPDLSNVAPGDVYATLRDHHARYAPAVERELQALVEEGKVRSFSGIIGSNGFVVEVVNRHREEVQRRLDALAEVGEIAASPL